MAAHTTASAWILLVACVCIASVDAGRNVNAVRRSTLAGQYIPGTAGWWYAIKPKNGNGTFCGLRDFPPYGGYGASRMYCPFSSYDHYWMWRIVKVNTNSSAVVSSGDEVYLTIYNPMPYKYCQLRTNVICGYSTGTKFVVEKANGTGVISFVNDDVVFRVNGSYCSLSGRGHGQQFTCRATSKATATVFTVATSSFVQTQLINRLSNKPCGGYFYQGAPGVSRTVFCLPANYPGFVTNLTVALQTPGAPFIAAGASVAFKAYDDFYTYHVATWRQSGVNVTYVPDATQGPSQWFSLEPASGEGAGEELRSSTLVALRSTSTGLFCGQRVHNVTVITCDNPGPVLNLTDGYKYTFNMVL